MANVQMQARSSTDGQLYTWLASGLDFAGAGFTGPGSAQDVAVSMRPAGGGGGGLVVSGSPTLDQVPKWNGTGAVWGDAGGAGAGGSGFPFTLSTTTTDSDPGTGTLRRNDASHTATTFLYVDIIEYGGTDISDWLEHFVSLVGSIKGVLRLQSKSDPTKWDEYYVTGVTSASGYRKVAVTYKDGPGGLLTTAGDTQLSFDAIGVSSNLGNQSLANVKSIGLNEVDAGSTGSGTKNFDWTTGVRQHVTGNGNATATFTNPGAPMAVQLLYTQDGTGGRTLDLSGIGIVWLDGVVWTPNPNHDTTSALVLDYDGTTWRGYGRRDGRVINETTAARTFSAVDIGSYINGTYAGATTFTIPPNSTTSLPLEALITGIAAGAGQQIEFVAGSGAVTIRKQATRNAKTAEQYSPWALKQVALNVWDLSGDLELA